MRTPTSTLFSRGALAAAALLTTLAGCGIETAGGGSDTSTTSSGGGGTTATGGTTSSGGTSTGGTGGATTGGTGGAPECTTAADCPAPADPCLVGACNGGLCAAAFAPAGAPCSEGGGATCDGAGACVECLSTADCLPPEVCNPAHQCVVAPLGQACNAAPGQPAPECNGLYCADGVCCDAKCLGACQKCNLPGSAGTCSPLANAWDSWPENSFLGCGVPNACPNSCDLCGPNATCIHEAGFFCGQDSECQTGHCSSNRCCGTACTDPCKQCDQPFLEGSCVPVPDGSDPKGACGPGGVCYGGSCKKTSGYACAQGAECLGSICADGVCCVETCTGLCRRCAAGTGLCGFVPAGQDPDNECPGAQTCNGSGACQ